MSIRVLVVDDESMIRRGFRMIIESELDMEVVAEASDGEQAIAAARRFSPHLILMDVRMPRMDGIAATRAIVTATDSAPRSQQGTSRGGSTCRAGECRRFLAAARGSEHRVTGSS